MKIPPMEGGEVVVEGEGGIGLEVDMETTKIMEVIQIGAEVVGEAEDGDIVVLDIKEAEVEVAGGTTVAGEGWVVEG